MKIDPMKNWRDLNAVIKGYSEEEVLAMIEEEVTGRGRKSSIIRLHQVYSGLRAKRERAILLERAGKK